MPPYFLGWIMRAYEFMESRTLEEGWKEKLAAAGVISSLLTGIPTPTAKDPATTTTVQAQLQPSRPIPDKPALATDHPSERILRDAAYNAGIRGMWLAQLMANARHETQNFTRLSERGGAARFNRIYGNRYGNTSPEDGNRYRGRAVSYTHLTLPTKA